MRVHLAFLLVIRKPHNNKPPQYLPRAGQSGLDGRSSHPFTLGVTFTSLARHVYAILNCVCMSVLCIPFAFIRCPPALRWMSRQSPSRLSRNISGIPLRGERTRFDCDAETFLRMAIWNNLQLTWRTRYLDAVSATVATVWVYCVVAFALGGTKAKLNALSTAVIDLLILRQLTSHVVTKPVH